MDSVEQYAKWTHACLDSASDTDERDERADARMQYWQREAQIHATLAVAAALVEIRDLIAAK